MRNYVKKFARLFGLDIARYRPASSPAAQLAKILEICSTDIVFDIGANEGQFGKDLRASGYTGKIVSFEPLTSARKKLLRLAARDKNWIVHDQCAIGDQNGDIDIHIAGNSVSSSILPMLESHFNAAVGSAYIASEKVQICKLDSISSCYLTSDSNLFIKIDTQGYEWQVLDGANDTLKRSRGVLCELSLMPLYDGQRLWQDIIDRLDARGFILWAFQKGFTDPRSGRSLQIDGAFLRRDLQ